MNSMTGYGHISTQSGGYDLVLEIRSVNYRFLEISVKLPRSYGYLEDKIKERFQGKISRGKIEVSMTLRRIEGKEQTVQIQHETVVAYMRTLLEENQRLALELKGGVSECAFLQQDLGLSMLLHLPDVFRVQAVEEDETQIWETVSPALDEAIDSFLMIREIEGVYLKLNIASHLDALEQMVKQVEQLVPSSVQLYYDKIYAKLQELLAEQTIDVSRLVTEAVIVAEKTAVDEEFVRLHSHITQFRALLESEKPMGRKMDFLIQEMNREVNTTGSKS